MMAKLWQAEDDGTEQAIHSEGAFRSGSVKHRDPDRPVQKPDKEKRVA